MARKLTRAEFDRNQRTWGNARHMPIPIGQRVELYPGMDAWMMGDRYGAVEKVGRKLVHVRMDRSRRLLRVPADRLAFIAR